MILLARHGETDDNAPPKRLQGSRDTPLNDRGRAQAAALAEAVRAEGIAAVWTSPLRRAAETAQIVSRALELREAPRVDARLREWHGGAWEGRLVAELEREDPHAWAAWQRAGAAFRFPGPGGESLGEQQARVLAALADVGQGPLPALVICHGGTIRSAVASRHPRGLDAFHELEVANAQPIELPEPQPAAVTAAS